MPSIVSSPDPSAGKPVAPASPNEPSIDTREPRTRFDVERQVLCARIEALERELARERRRRQQVLDHYEQVLDRRQSENGAASGGLLRGLF